ncbi:HAD family phosphatase [Halobacteriovorax vibrionivorans]|uniref:HAD family phosphatase n=1 Tax=Halobacteriovorax vibrionivorans TaxID=2152716 RepID=A0ABY0IIY7_9BACT|nr:MULTISPECIES: HAD family phosphatase [Halobacteriovorax]RZF22898.1 HAD family phosphatase [Halobacteriovorax vibrionivorans]TGD47309.1 HAD family phosphatase [Halobacteriovorax sp. Y22]
MNRELCDFLHLEDSDIDLLDTYTKEKKYIFFDMDGTILNSEPLHYQVVQKLCGNNEIPSMEETFGMSDEEVYPLIQNALGLASLEEFLELKNSALIGLIGQSDPNNIRHRNIRKLLESLTSKGLKLALVTASQYEVTHPLLEHCELKKYFEIIITEREVEKGKPNPEPYLMAQNHFNAKSEECLIFEDSPTGIRAAQSSGIDYIVVKWFEGE